jgi:hypothetical protein
MPDRIRERLGLEESIGNADRVEDKQIVGAAHDGWNSPGWQPRLGSEAFRLEYPMIG